MNLNFTPAENELLMMQTAVVRKKENEAGPGVVLMPSHKTLCRTEDEEGAVLISKLFNKGLSIPS